MTQAEDRAQGRAASCTAVYLADAQDAMHAAPVAEEDVPEKAAEQAAEDAVHVAPEEAEDVAVTVYMCARIWLCSC